MGTVTRAQLRRMVAEKLMMCGSGFPTTVTATTLVDINAPERKRENDDYWNGGTLYIANGSGGPAGELVSESTVTETETSTAVVDVVSTTDPLDTYATKITTSATAGSVGVATYPVTVTALRIVEVSFWCKGDGTVCGRWGFRASTGATTDVIGAWATKAGEPTYVTGKTWTRIVRRLVVPTAATACSLDLYSSSELSKSVYFDKPSVRILGQERYISDWVNSTSTFTVATWTTNPGVGSAYEAYYKTFSLTDYNRVIDDALRYAWPFLYQLAEDESIETSSGYMRYTLPDSVDPDYIVKVELEEDTGDATKPYARYAYWHIRQDSGTNYLQFDVQPPDTRSVRITHCKPIEPLLSDFDTVNDAWVPFIVARCQAELYEQMLAKTSRTDRTQVGENRDAFYQKAAYELGRVRIQFPNTHIKPHLYGGR